MSRAAAAPMARPALAGVEHPPCFGGMPGCWPVVASPDGRAGTVALTVRSFVAELGGVSNQSTREGAERRRFG